MNFWDQRYNEPGFAYGQMPNQFLAGQLARLPAGSLLLPGEGEGRNAVFAARKGWKVTAVDLSSVGREKALQWAESEGLELDYQLADLSAYQCSDPSFDLVAIIFLHLSPDHRPDVHRRLAACLKPGGKLVMECFHKRQLAYGTGGPPVESMLYSEAELRQDFRELTIESCEELEEEFDEGAYHQGKASVIRLTATKPVT